MTLENKIAVVTGGSSGIGLAIVQDLVKEGYHVSFTGRNKEKLDSVRKELEKGHPGKINAYQVDINDIVQIKEMVEDIESNHGDIDVFVNNAGAYVSTNLDSDFSINDIKDVKGDGFTVGLQLGAGVELGKLGIDVRWERGFNGIESSLLDGATNVEFDTRVNQIIFGLSYRL